MMDFYKNQDTAGLISLTRGRDDSAFSELVARYTPMMNKVIASFLSPTLRYDEAFSEACVALHRAAISYDLSKNEEITFGLYARICVYRRLCDVISAGKKDAAVINFDVELLSAESNIEQSIVGRERMSAYFDKACEILSEYEYQVFRLYVDGYSTAEISEKLGKDTKSVENAKSRMLKHLREESDAFFDI